MKARQLSVPGAWEFTPQQFGDDRGRFLEWFKASEFEAVVGAPLTLLQANCSVSAAGVLRGIHYTDDPPGQAKYVTCVRGAFLDVVVDLRPGSPTFGHWDHVLLDDVDRRVVHLPAGLGHAILSLEDQSTVMYLCSLEYSPELDHDLDALDPELGIAWPSTGRDGAPLEYVRSGKDAAAPTLRAAFGTGPAPAH
ncbi:dTDP-4-keto-6-deoxy-D-glucose epimerase [Tsukamurella conjunctivitidis]|uniref:dTDP-4-keto-6-deoxy-D-glucose epimerase n=1 Tax=Tsukamurella conjunctivitidis TaxID=2592068 RepID=A0A5C5RSQ4_9ACTN|nr:MULTISPECIES: dTDP-4-dehydrorhamnose 3,5-epimerase [Tsukamurella]RDB47228.1 dTDP-4-keto-6-deoxy-D-glucose epimerase [Tsukamurella tyrosinosolvens]TWS25652.1 dTDP-4-keto-6-deoxy-D-glucose epimerase [Tsukamurella conjunctivitidis]